MGASTPRGAPQQRGLLHAFDHVLLAEEAWPDLAPDVVLQLGARLPSKRLARFLEWAALPPQAGSNGAPPRWGATLPLTIHGATCGQPIPMAFG